MNEERGRSEPADLAMFQGGARFDQFDVCAVGFVGRFGSIDILTVSASERSVAAISCSSRNGAECTDREPREATLKLFMKSFTRFDSINGFRNRFGRFDLLLDSIDTRFSCH